MIHPNLEPHENYRVLQQLLNEGKQYLEWSENDLFNVKPDVSGWSIAYHLHHLAKANGSIPRLIERLKSGILGEADIEGNPEMLQMIQDGIVPRGRKSPEITEPPADLNYELLVRDFNRMTKASQRIEPLLDELHTITLRFPHIYYGPLSALEWLRFMRIHTRHHMGIIGEIKGSGVWSPGGRVRGLESGVGRLASEAGVLRGLSRQKTYKVRSLQYPAHQSHDA